MDYTPIHELIKAVSESSLTTFEMEQDGVKLVMKKEAYAAQPQQVYTAPTVQLTQPEVHAPAAPEKVEVVTEAAAPSGEFITSPMVGTFYAASAPDKPALVKVGDKVKKGQVVCIIEAMKLMNEIESTVDGEVVSILAENEDMVEFGQKLFEIR